MTSTTILMTHSALPPIGDYKYRRDYENDIISLQTENVGYPVDEKVYIALEEAGYIITNQ